MSPVFSDFHAFARDVPSTWVAKYPTSAEKTPPNFKAHRKLVQYAFN